MLVIKGRISFQSIRATRCEVSADGGANGRDLSDARG